MPSGPWLLVCVSPSDDQSGIAPIVYELTPISDTECTGIELMLCNIGYSEGSNLDDATSIGEFTFHCLDSSGQVHTVDTTNPEGFPGHPVMIDDVYAAQTLDPAAFVFKYVAGIYGEPSTVIVTYRMQAEPAS